MPHLHECCTYLNHQSLSFAFQKVFVSSFHTSCTSQSSCSMLSGQKPLKFKWVTSLHEKGNITLNINVINCNNNNNNKSKKTSMNSLEVLLNTIYYMKNLQTIVWIFCFFCRRKQRRLHRQTEIVMLNTDVCVCVCECWGAWRKVRSLSGCNAAWAVPHCVQRFLHSAINNMWFLSSLHSFTDKNEANTETILYFNNLKSPVSATNCRSFFSPELP